MEVLHPRCCGLDVHKDTVVACLRLVSDGKVTTQIRTFQTTTAELLRWPRTSVRDGGDRCLLEADMARLG